MMQAAAIRRRCGLRAATTSDSHWSSPPEPAINQLRLIGKDRLSEDVFEGHRTAKGNHKLERGERRAAEIEKVSAPADLFLGDTQHLGPLGCEPTLRRRIRHLVVLLGDVQLRGQRRQRLLVHLAVAR